MLKLHDMVCGVYMYMCMCICVCVISVIEKPKAIEIQ